MTYLLDVNLLYALHFSQHIHYATAQSWYVKQNRDTLATCSITQCGLLRLLMIGVVGQTLEIEEARKVLNRFTQKSNHLYWADSPQVLALTQPIAHRLQGHRQITDAYLLGLAAHNKAKLATMDKGIIHLAGKEFSEFVEYLS
jgi:uncharacterized protein